jgi:hypothetical protein
MKLRPLVLALFFALCLALSFSSAPAPAATTRISKLLVVVEENHGLAAMLAGMPNIASLSRRFGYASHYRAITHPSEPNYLAIGWGSTMGDKSDHSTALNIHGQTVYGRAIAAGRRSKIYAESMTSNCQLSSSGGYAVKHNPWPFAVDERAQCRSGNVPLGALAADVTAGTLPNIGMLVPNLCHDAHDCSLATADGWLKPWLAKIMAGPDYTSGRLAVVVTADEDNGTTANTVLTTVITRQLDNKHKVVTTGLNHYSLSRLHTQVAHTACLRNGCTASDLAAAFGLSY